MSASHPEKSLQDVHQSIDPGQQRKNWKKIFAFFGPAYLVSVGYMDPGNWATDIEGGSSFGYSLLWVLLMSNIMALLLQSLSARLGIVYGKDLAQCSRELYPPYINIILYIFAELAIAACDLAEVLGMAIGLNLLFKIPLLWGVTITLLDTFLLLYLQKLGMRKMEAFIVALIAIIGVCFFVEIFLAKPDIVSISKGFVPQLVNDHALYIAIGIIGATVMPHNLYLHSALVQTRKIERTYAAIKKAIKFNTIDSAIALNIAFLVNAAILIMAGSTFFNTGNQHIKSIQDAHALLTPLLGSNWAPILFAIALIAAGQSSTITGTLAGQIIMEGYLHLRLNPMARRLLTRLLAIVPAILVILISGESKIDELLVFSQVLLSMQLAFAVIPLIHFVSDRDKMGDFAINQVTRIAAWVIASIILVLNIKLFLSKSNEWLQSSPYLALKMAIIVLDVAVFALILITLIYPIFIKNIKKKNNFHASQMLANDFDNLEQKEFTNIALALDFSAKDKKVIQNAINIAKTHTQFTLIHIVESASAQIMGIHANDFESQTDQIIMDEYVSQLTQKGWQVKGILGFNDRIEAIKRIIAEEQCDVLIVGSHGHTTLNDWLLGETINTLRHQVNIPVFIAI